MQTFCENSYFRGVNIPEPEDYVGLAQRLAQSANPEASFDPIPIDLLTVSLTNPPTEFIHL
jgi:hypothetical protein